MIKLDSALIRVRGYHPSLKDGDDVDGVKRTVGTGRVEMIGV